MATFEMLGPDTWEDFVGAPVAMLMLGKSDCAACNEWTTELQDWLEADEEVPAARYGKILLDQRGLGSFKKAFPWLAGVDHLPFNVIFKDGEKVKDWAGGGVDRMANRLRRLEEG